MAALHGYRADGEFLDKFALHRIQRRQRVMASLERPDLARDAEEIAEETLQVRSQVDEEAGMLLSREPFGVRAGS